MDTIKKIIEFAQGKKTYIVAVAAVIYGIYTKDTNLIIIGLGMAGIRNGISTEVAKVLTAPNPVVVIKKDAPGIVAEVTTQAVEEIK